MNRDDNKWGTIVISVLLTIIGFFCIKYLSSIDDNFKEMKAQFKDVNNKFDAFISSYNLMDKRVDRLEFQVFGQKNNYGNVYQTTSAAE